MTLYRMKKILKINKRIWGLFKTLNKEQQRRVIRYYLINTGTVTIKG